MGRRTLLLLAALLVAAVGTVLVFLYASSANARALSNQHPVDVLVAKTQITVGTSVLQAAEKGMFERKTITRAAAAPGALAPGALASLNGKVALSTIYPGEQILAAKFGTAAQTSGLPIPPGMVAVSVPLEDPARVAGFVGPGSMVGIFVTLSPSGGTARGGTATFTQLLLPKAQVIAVGQSTAAAAPTNGNNKNTNVANQQPLARATVTVALNLKDAQKLIFAAQQGDIYFVLLTDKSGIVPGQQVALATLFK